MDSTVISLFLGVILGFLSTLAGNLVVETRQLRSKKKSFTIRLKLELIQAFKSLDEIRNAQTRQTWYDFQLLDILDTSVANLEGLRKDIDLLGDEQVQQKAYDVIIKISKLAKNMRGIQSYEYADETNLDKGAVAGKKRLINDTRIKNDVDLTDLKRDIDDLKKIVENTDQ